MAKDETEEGITGLPIPKKKMSPKKRHAFEKERRAERKKREDPRVGDTFSQHRMTGSRGHGSQYENPLARNYHEEVLVNYLLGEGFASDEKSAQAIAGAMSEEWVQSIVEASEEDKERLRNYEVRYYQKHGGMPPDPEKRRQLRDAARRLPPA